VVLRPQHSSGRRRHRHRRFALLARMRTTTDLKFDPPAGRAASSGAQVLVLPEVHPLTPCVSNPFPPCVSNPEPSARAARGSMSSPEVATRTPSPCLTFLTGVLLVVDGFQRGSACPRRAFHARRELQPAHARPSLQLARRLRRLRSSNSARHAELSRGCAPHVRCRKCRFLQLLGSRPATFRVSFFLRFVQHRRCLLSERIHRSNVIIPPSPLLPPRPHSTTNVTAQLPQNSCLRRSTPL
jgi:hypothetical protein